MVTDLAKKYTYKEIIAEFSTLMIIHDIESQFTVIVVHRYTNFCTPIYIEKII